MAVGPKRGYREVPLLVNTMPVAEGTPKAEVCTAYTSRAWAVLLQKSHSTAHLLVVVSCKGVDKFPLRQMLADKRLNEGVNIVTCVCTVAANSSQLASIYALL